MPGTYDLDWQLFSTVQTDESAPPSKMLAATTIAPNSALTLLLGSTDVNTITPPVSGFHVLWIMWDGTPGALLTTGNIAIGTTTAVSKVPLQLIYEPVAAKYYLQRGTAS